MSVASVVKGGRFGRYEIVEELGSGGMGRVYRAKDVRLGRPVALKLLHAKFEGDPSATARFELEAQVLASLNHPGIASIYGLEECDGLQALAMELVDGPTLAERLASGSMRVDETLRIAKLIAEAIDYAHKKGVVHRDLKPSNVKLTADGQVKLLDFGLAKMLALDDRRDSSEEKLLATETWTGVIVGTFAYMPPEQAQAKPSDCRADVWAFGAILFEMLAGVRPFCGETASDTIALLLTKEPDWNQLPGDTPIGVRNLLQRCLEKDPALRLRDMSEAPMTLRCCLACRVGAWPLITRPAPAPSKRPHRVRRWVLSALLAAAVIVVATVWLRSPRPPMLPLARLRVELAQDAVRTTGSGPDAILSPNGRRLVFTSRGPDGQRLSTRVLDEDHSTQLPGTENARDPFFSPDGQSIAFFADGKLMKLSLKGGPPLVLCDAADSRGGAWGDDGYIVLAPATRGGLFRVPLEGGPMQPLTRLESSQRERTHRWPQVLPGARAVLFTAHSTLGNFDGASLELQSPATGRRRTLLRGAYYGRYLPSGHLLYVHQGTIYGMLMDPAKLKPTGAPVPVVEGVACDPSTGGAQFDVSRTGTLIYRSGTASGGAWSIAWLDRTGAMQPLSAAPATSLAPRFSPDGSLIAMGILGATGYDIWTYDWRRDRMTRLTFTSGFDGYPVWSPDGKAIAIESDRDGVGNLYLIRAEGGAEAQRLTFSKDPQTPGSFSPDGTRLAFCQRNPDDGTDDIWTIPLTRTESGELKPGQPERFLCTPANENEPAISPDGHWLAYESDASGTPEIYVRPFPGPGGLWQISSGGGSVPIWSRSERMLLFKTRDRRIMAAQYTIRGDSFVPDKPRLWCKEQIPNSRLGRDFDLAPDGRRIAVQVPAENLQDSKAGHAEVLLNFFDELRRKLPAKR